MSSLLPPSETKIYIYQMDIKIIFYYLVFDTFSKTNLNNSHLPNLTWSSGVILT